MSKVGMRYANSGDGVHIYVETSERRAGILAVAGNLPRHYIPSSEADLQRTVAEILGIEAKPSSLLKGSVTRTMQLKEGIKLLENREAGAYLWKREDGREWVDVHTRLRGWRFTLAYPGPLIPRGRTPTRKNAIGIWERYFPVDHPLIIVAQFLCPGSRAFGIVCWAPAEFFSRYEILFERVLSEFRVYDLPNPRNSIDSSVS
jgi:hypothetical protein